MPDGLEEKATYICMISDIRFMNTTSFVRKVVVRSNESLSVNSRRAWMAYTTGSHTEGGKLCFPEIAYNQPPSISTGLMYFSDVRNEVSKCVEALILSLSFVAPDHQGGGRHS